VLTNKGQLAGLQGYDPKTDSIDETELSDRSPFLKSLDQLHHIIPTATAETPKKATSKRAEKKGAVDAKLT
jgi:hypothetical protein